MVERVSNFYFQCLKVHLCIHCPASNQITVVAFQWLTHTLLQRTLYSKGTLCIVTSCSKEQFASNWHVTVCSLTHFTPQHTLPPGMFFSSAQFASQHPLLPKTPCSSTHFASQHTLLLRTLCSSAHFASKNTLLLGTLYSSTHFAS